MFCVTAAVPLSVLIVDDDPSVLETLQRILPAEIELESAVDAAGASKLLGEREYCGLVLDLVLIDSSGLDVLRFMKEQDLNIPCVVVSGKVPAYVREMLDQDQVKLVLPKPVEEKLLAAIVLGLCGMT